jgi:hypothetical protein
MIIRDKFLAKAYTASQLVIYDPSKGMIIRDKFLVNDQKFISYISVLRPRAGKVIA